MLKIFPKDPLSHNPQDLKDEIKGQYKELDIIYQQFAEYGKSLTYPSFWDQEQVNEWCKRFFPYAKTIEHQIRAIILLHKFWLEEKQNDSTLVLIFSILLPENYSPINSKSKEFTKHQADIFKMTLIGYTQSQIAEYLNITQQAVSQHWLATDKKVRKLLREFRPTLFSDLPEPDIEDIKHNLNLSPKDGDAIISAPNKPPEVEVPITEQQLDLKKQADELLKKANK